MALFTFQCMVYAEGFVQDLTVTIPADDERIARSIASQKVYTNHTEWLACIPRVRKITCVIGELVKVVETNE